MAERSPDPRGRGPRRGQETPEEPSEESVERETAEAGRPERGRAEPAPRIRPADRPRAERCLVAPAMMSPGGMAPGVMAPGVMAGPGLAGETIIDQLGRDPEVHVVRVVRSTDQVPAAPFGGAGQAQFGQAPLAAAPPVAVVELAADRAMALATRPDIHVEVDQLLRHGEQLPAAAPGDTGAGTLGETIPLTFRVENDHGEELAGAVVQVVGGLYPAVGVTAVDGTVEVAVPADSVDLIRGVYVRPRTGCWSAWLGRPLLTSTEPNVVVCRRLWAGSAAAGSAAGAGAGSGVAEHATEHLVESWANRAMAFDRLPPTYRGHGVKIAIVGSGVDVSHPDLADRIAGGINVVGQDDKSWGEDLIGRSTRYAAIIAGLDNGRGVVGVVPDVELHVCKVLPGGRFSDLIEALDYCITHQVDVIDLGVGSDQVSALVAYKIEQARQAGIACIAGAGDSGGPVQFPAALSNVLAVSAIGRLGTYPPDSFPATQIAGVPSPEGYFAARFSCSGPEVDVCAPGVAIISAASPEGYAPADGTAVAASYVSALAALVFAHHPDFQYEYRFRGPARVDRLAQIIRASCRPVVSDDENRCGAGLPDALLAVGLTPQAQPAQAGPWVAWPWVAGSWAEAWPSPQTWGTAAAWGTAEGRRPAGARRAAEAAGTGGVSAATLAAEAGAAASGAAAATLAAAMRSAGLLESPTRG